MINAVPSRDGGGANQRYPQRHGEPEKGKIDHHVPNAHEVAVVFERPARIVVDGQGHVIQIAILDAKGHEVIREISPENQPNAESARGVLVDLQT